MNKYGQAVSGVSYQERIHSVMGVSIDIPALDNKFYLTSVGYTEMFGGSFHGGIDYSKELMDKGLVQKVLVKEDTSFGAYYNIPASGKKKSQRSPTFDFYAGLTLSETIEPDTIFTSDRYVENIKSPLKHPEYIARADGKTVKKFGK